MLRQGRIGFVRPQVKWTGADRIGTQALEVATLGFSARGARTMSRLDWRGLVCLQEITVRSVMCGVTTGDGALRVGGGGRLLTS